LLVGAIGFEPLTSSASRKSAAARRPLHARWCSSVVVGWRVSNGVDRSEGGRAGQVFMNRGTSLRADLSSQVFAGSRTVAEDKVPRHGPEGSKTAGPTFKTGVRARALRRVRFPSASANLQACNSPCLQGWWPHLSYAGALSPQLFRPTCAGTAANRRARRLRRAAPPSPRRAAPGCCGLSRRACAPAPRR
jgi:hypothetical protein